MSLDFTLTDKSGEEVYSSNITSNLSEMAEAAGVYERLWAPEEHGFTTAASIVAGLEGGLAAIEGDPSRFARYNATNSWGMVKQFVPWLRGLLQACRAHPNATISTC